MWPAGSKVDHLPVERKDYGYVQRSVYHQPDLHHEEVIELDSPFASLVASGTHIFTFLLLGDQNAGKSTFLHAFTYHHDRHFLQLTSFLPMLTSTFINSRFLQGAGLEVARDEPPFLDTDLARGTVLMTREDFEFFLREWEIVKGDEGERPKEFCFAPDTRFVVLQFIEIGGDHLDSLMAMKTEDEQQPHKQEKDETHPQRDHHLEAILKRSLNLLKDARKTLYFVNASTMFQSKGEEADEKNTISMNEETETKNKTKIKLRTESWQLLLRRLRWLSSVLRHNSERKEDGRHQILVYLSRLPVAPGEALDIEMIAQQTDLPLPLPPLSSSLRKEEGNKMEEAAEEAAVRAVEEQFLQLLRAAAKKEGWDETLDIVGVYRANHIVDTEEEKVEEPNEKMEQEENEEEKEEDRPLNVDGIIRTLVRLFQNKMTHSVENDPQFFVLRHLLRCFQQLLHSASSSPPHYIDQETFHDYLEELEYCELPEPILLQKFERVCLRLVWSRMALLRYSGDQSFSNIEFSIDEGRNLTKTWKPRKEDLCELAIRFPCFGPLLEVLKSYFARNVPPEFWLEKEEEEEAEAGEEKRGWTKKLLVVKGDEHLRHQMFAVLKMLEEEIVHQWKALFESRQTAERKKKLFWLLEEWCMLKKLMKEEEKEGVEEEVFVLPRVTAPLEVTVAALIPDEFVAKEEEKEEEEDEMKKLFPPQLKVHLRVEAK
ncbi:Ankyrin repeat-containing protein [Balamuthia mandrillaris]